MYQSRPLRGVSVSAVHRSDNFLIMSLSLRSPSGAPELLPSGEGGNWDPPKCDVLQASLPPLPPSPAWGLPVTPEASTSTLPNTICPRLTTPHLSLQQDVFDLMMNKGFSDGMIESSEYAAAEDTPGLLPVLEEPLYHPSPSTATTSSSPSSAVWTPPASMSPFWLPSSSSSSSPSSCPSSSSSSPSTPPSYTSPSDTTHTVHSGPSKVPHTKTARPKRPRSQNPSTASRTSHAHERKPRNRQFSERPDDITTLMDLETMSCLRCGRKTKRIPDLRRHIRTHYKDRIWACIGVPFDPANKEHTQHTGDDLLAIKGVVMLGGCGTIFTRDDAYVRHRHLSQRGCRGREAAQQVVSKEDLPTLREWLERRAAAV